MIEVIRTIKPAGDGDYVSLADWYADRRGDLVARNTREVALVYGGGNVGDLWMGIDPETFETSPDSVTDPLHYFSIRAVQGEGHGGKYDEAKAFIHGATDNPVWIAIPFTRFGPGISIKSNVNLSEIVGNPHAVIVTGMGPGEYCIVDGVIGAVAAAQCFRAEYCDAGTPQIFRNCVAQRLTSQSSIGFRATNATIRLSNCLAFSGDNPCYADNDNGEFGHPAQGGIVYTENCAWFHGQCYVAVGPGSTILQGDFDFTSSQEATDPDRRGLTATAALLTNPDIDALDARLTEGSPLIGAGTDLSAEGFFRDFQLERRGPTWDVGPDQFEGDLLADVEATWHSPERGSRWVRPALGHIWTRP